MSSWRALLLRVGDKCPEYGGSVDYKDHIETCHSTLSEFDHSKDDLLQLLLQCAEQLPHKIPFYSVLVGLINLENEDFGKDVVDAIHSKLQDALLSENCDKIRISLRFLTALMCSKLVLPSSVIEVFETLLSSALLTIDEEAGNLSWQPCADFYVTCILSSLPWGGTELIEQVPEEFDRVIVQIQSYLLVRKRSYDNSFTAFETDGDKSVTEKDFLEDLWDRIQALSSNGWKVDSVPRPHLSFEEQLVTGKSYSLPHISCPKQSATSQSTISREKDNYEVKLKYPQRLRRLHIFPSSKTEHIQPIDRFIVEEYLLDVLLFFNGCRKECASYMASLPVSFRYEYLMAETIFSQLMFLPQPPFRPIYYTLVIIDLCKALPGAFPAVVAGAVRALFDRIADLDMECRTRLILWFSHHLSNFQYFWPWEEWAHVKDLPRWAPQRVFVQEVLEREVRLSYWDKIKQSIENAPALEELLPPKSGPNFKYNSEDDQGYALSRELRIMIRGRKTAREISPWVEENIIKVHGPKFALEVVIQTLLDIGSKSFTHLITVLERYGQVITKLCAAQDMQVLLIDEVSSYWKNSTQMTAIAIDRMMGYRLICNLAIISWVFSLPNIEQFHVSDRPWEVLRNTINKTYNRIADLRKEIQTLEKGVSIAEETASKALKEFEAADARLEVVDGQPVQAEKPGRLKRLKGYAEKAKEEEVSVRESLEAKEALFARALEENKILFVSLYKSFTNVLMERLPPVSDNGDLPKLRPEKIDAMSVDLEEPPSMEVDHDNGQKDESENNGERVTHSYDIKEQDQWCLCTLGYLKAISRQYATEIWPHIETLEAEIFSEDTHPLIKKAVLSGLCRKMVEL
ncbi:nuclear cap-binding protein subunit 1-like [Zingiber officinale]|uniref:nuclear cap-binding protein subunit 1-like n=1 Tax=Zingiber officinale TaxID=94328 RepID=UPI001C4A81A8|nr:nuclear cap-binding protein subunit 1-like [Zingiber officinale]